MKSSKCKIALAGTTHLTRPAQVSFLFVLYVRVTFMVLLTTHKKQIKSAKSVESNYSKGMAKHNNSEAGLNRSSVLSTIVAIAGVWEANIP